MATQVDTKEHFSSLTLVWLYMLAGNATFTLQSNISHKHFTFRVKRKDSDEEFWFVSVLTGPDDFTYLGCFAGPEHKYVPDRRFRIGKAAPSRKAFEWLMRRIDADEPVLDECTIWHEGKCGRCGRPLTTPESVRSGLGPVCREKSLS